MPWPWASTCCSLFGALLAVSALSQTLPPPLYLWARQNSPLPKISEALTCLWRWPSTPVLTWPAPPPTSGLRLAVLHSASICMRSSVCGFPLPPPSQHQTQDSFSSGPGAALARSRGALAVCRRGPREQEDVPCPGIPPSASLGICIATTPSRPQVKLSPSGLHRGGPFPLSSGRSSSGWTRDALPPGGVLGGSPSWGFPEASKGLSQFQNHRSCGRHERNHQVLE